MHTPQIASTTTLAHLRLAGWAFHQGPEIESPITPGTALSLKPEPDNPHDPHAIAVFCGSVQIGYLPAHAAPDYGTLVAQSRVQARAANVHPQTGEVLTIELSAATVPALAGLTVARLPPADDFSSALLEAARTKALLTALPADLTAAGMSASYDPSIGYQQVSTYKAGTGDELSDREVNARFLPYQHVYLVREEATGEFHERISVWLPGSRHFGFLQKQEGDRLLRAFDKRGEQVVLRAYLDLDDAAGTRLKAPSPATFSVVVLRVTIAGHGRDADDATAKGLASTPVAQDLLRLADDGYPRISDAPAGPAYDGELHLRKGNAWASAGSGAVADYLKKLRAA